MSDIKECPHCKISFEGPDIYRHFLDQNEREGGCLYPTTVEEIIEGSLRYPDQYLPLPENLSTMSQNELDAWNYARSYGWTFDNPKCFGAVIIGVETEQYDGITWWHCSSCKYTWPRFPWSDKKYLDGDWAKDYIYE